MSLRMPLGACSTISSVSTKVLRITQADATVQILAINVLRKLCGRTEYLPESYLLSDKFNLSGVPRASSGSSEIWMELLKGRCVAVKSLRVSEMGDKAKIREVGN